MQPSKVQPSKVQPALRSTQAAEPAAVHPSKVHPSCPSLAQLRWWQLQSGSCGAAGAKSSQACPSKAWPALRSAQAVSLAVSLAWLAKREAAVHQA